MRHSSRERGQLSVRRAQKCEPDVDAVIDYLRRVHPHKTAEFVAAAAEQQPTTVRKWLDRGSAPSFPAFVKLVAAYGPALLAVAFGDEPPEWLSRAARAERQAALEAEHARIGEELAKVRSQS